MEAVVHKANTRGKVDFGWLKSNHTFSFGNYMNPERIRFASLRVLNDDIVAPGRGFDPHPHQDMEIISIPLKGALEHKDSIGTAGVIRSGEVQVMSAGTGIVHSEYNHSKTEPVNFLQIWVLPDRRGAEPRYDQKQFSVEERRNKFQVVVSPKDSTEGLWINQNAWFSMGNLEAGVEVSYQPKNEERGGVYAFLISGKVNINDTELSARDGAGFPATELLKVKALEESELLLMDVPEIV
ncbi:pirin family protein [Leptospira langatensis]|uniref:Pirin family protein n=1 Tax=Leptospira langatensis TaxID=2484983 RepID=A0A5F1ZW79_9LEPT|nr:pirin family protein [Leptospira langatensis]TGJ98172.1 pirin family protein [Leptospira langatensis]TGL43086.1 pirin family protein [Leptospira langatensis]